MHDLYEADFIKWLKWRNLRYNIFYFGVIFIAQMIIGWNTVINTLSKIVGYFVISLLIAALAKYQERLYKTTREFAAFKKFQVKHFLKWSLFIKRLKKKWLNA